VLAANPSNLSASISKKSSTHLTIGEIEHGLSGNGVCNSPGLTQTEANNAASNDAGERADTNIFEDNRFRGNVASRNATPPAFAEGIDDEAVATESPIIAGLETPETEPTGTRNGTTPSS
jgi:hypothetical protein